MNAHDHAVCRSTVGGVTYLQDLLKEIVRTGIASSDKKIDHLLEAIRSFPGESPTRFDQIAGMIQVLQIKMQREEALVMLAVALVRLRELEDFEKTVPRESPKS